MKAIYKYTILFLLAALMVVGTMNYFNNLARKKYKESNKLNDSIILAQNLKVLHLKREIFWLENAKQKVDTVTITVQGKDKIIFKDSPPEDAKISKGQSKKDGVTINFAVRTVIQFLDATAPFFLGTANNTSFK